ncbi:MAG: ABC transporter permease [Christensenellales bacterium]
MSRDSIFALAKQGLKANEKSTRTIIAMMAVSMIIIIPVFVLLTGVGVSMNAELNKAPYLLYIQGTCEDYRQNDGGREYLSQWDKAEKKIVYEDYELTNDYLATEATFCLEDTEYPLNKTKRSLTIIDSQESTRLLPENFAKAGGLFVEGYDQSFGGDNRAQIIISQAFLDTIGLTAGDVYGKEVSIFCKLAREETIDGYVCYRYKVVGVIKREWYEAFQSEMHHPLKGQFWVTSDNAYKDGQPVLRLTKDTEGYANIADKVQLNQMQKYMMLDVGKSWHRYTQIYVEAKDYAALVKTSSLIEASNVSGSNAFRGYGTLFKIAQSVGFMLMLTGIVLLVVTVAYYFLNVRFDVEKRKKYLTMLRAMGAQEQDVTKIYMAQASIICAKASAIFATVGFGVCVGIKYVVDALINMGSSNLLTSLSISWLSIIVPIAVMVALIFAIAILIGYASVKNVSKKEIMETLRGD